MARQIGTIFPVPWVPKMCRVRFGYVQSACEVIFGPAFRSWERSADLNSSQNLGHVGQNFCFLKITDFKIIFPPCELKTKHKHVKIPIYGTRTTFSKGSSLFDIIMRNTGLLPDRIGFNPTPSSLPRLLLHLERENSNNNSSGRTYSHVQ